MSWNRRSTRIATVAALVLGLSAAGGTAAFAADAPPATSSVVEVQPDTWLPTQPDTWLPEVQPDTWLPNVQPDTWLPAVQPATWLP